jgi:N-acetylglucosaminyldiphosphoundecaprenol N-acetyl-beta-D-mannosaminyltransferase
VYGLNLAVEQPWLQAFYQSADAVFCDGSGVLVGARLIGATLPERITYADWIWELAALAEQAQLSLYLLGAKPGIAEQAATALQARYSALRIAGTHHGYFDKEVYSPENQAVIDAINRSQADILLICFGMPLQEAWLRDNWLALHITVGLTGGAALDYAAGNLRRGPAVLTRTGFEWLARLLIEPRRLWKRYILGNPLFLYRVLRERFKQFV